MDADGQIYFGADGDIPEEDKKRLDEALIKARERREEDVTRLEQEMQEAKAEYERRNGLD
jgi:hypothetical protein